MAPLLFQKMSEIVHHIKNGLLEPISLLESQQQELKAKGFKNDYLDVYSMDKMEPVSSLSRGESYVLAAAVYLGKTRLIDNIIFKC